MRIFIYIVALIAFITVAYLAYTRVTAPTVEEAACTMDVMQCPDGSFVGRVGPTCEFEACPIVENGIPDDIEAHIESKAGLIRLASPEPYQVIESPLTITGEARGQWFFEATFPIVLTNWDGLIIAEGFATADGDWMTTEFVPFTASLTFTAPDFDNRGTLILQKSNASGLPEHDDALEIPIRFDEGELEVQ